MKTINMIIGTEDELPYSTVTLIYYNLRLIQIDNPELCYIRGELYSLKNQINSVRG